MKSDFSSERFAQLTRMEQNHFWFCSRRKLIDSVAQKYLAHIQTNSALDLGCGTGYNLANLALFKSFAKKFGLDTFATTKDAFPRNFDLLAGDVTSLPFPSSSLNLVTAFDVLEHVDDSICIKEIERVLSPCGSFIATVPALPWLWSYRDQAAGHKRRYTINSLKKLISSTELKVQEIRYFYWSLLPILLLTRCIYRHSSKNRDLEDTPAKIINNALRSLTNLDIYISSKLPLPFGSSIILVCSK